MARPRKTTGKTAFGKRTSAEKSFRTRRKDKPEDRDDRKSFGKRTDSRTRTSRFGRTDKPEFQRRRDDRPRKFGDSAGERSFKKKSFKPEDRADRRSFGKRTDNQERGSQFGRTNKPEFKQRRDDRPRKSGQFEASGDRPFKKKSFNPEEKPEFKKRSGRFDSRSSGPAQYSKKPFDKKRPREEGDKPFGKGSNYGLPYKRKPFNKLRDVKSPKRTHAEEKPKTDSDLIRLNKYIANSGVGSRREADELIKMGLVTVNGEVITEMGHKIKPTDEVRYEGRRLKAEKPVYILLNKPKGFITTTDDPQERNTVMNLVAGAGPERIYPVGRLDRNTTGLLLLTNDGDLADKLTHPSYNVKKIYRVELDKPITKNDFVKIQEGVYLEEGKALVDDLAIVDGDNKTLGIELHIGWNRIVRRIFESLGYQVIKLDRVVYAGLDKKDLGRGEWRFLKPEEIIRLKHFK